jgi:UDP-N-acetylmuramoyl-tripeptide--D-alanyl-D-alanine ligase
VGRHHVANALAAIAVAREHALDPAAVAAALGTLESAAGRMELRTLRGATLIADCYNANPDSVRAALDTLATWPATTQRIAVLGDMLELGSEASALHREIGAAIRDPSCGPPAPSPPTTPRARGAAGSRRAFPDKPELAAALWDRLAAGVTVLLKGSRGAALEDVLSALAARDAGAGERG